MIQNNHATFKVEMVIQRVSRVTVMLALVRKDYSKDCEAKDFFFREEVLQILVLCYL